MRFLQISKKAIIMHARSFIHGLVSDGPAHEHADKLMLYGQFVGDWIAEASEPADDGIVTRST